MVLLIIVFFNILFKHSIKFIVFIIVIELLFILFKIFSVRRKMI